MAPSAVASTRESRIVGMAGMVWTRVQEDSGHAYAVTRSVCAQRDVRIHARRTQRRGETRNDRHRE